jgi:hypothetical protein
VESSYPLIPLCRGVTFFQLEVPKGDDEFVDQWADPTLPPGVRVSISFAQPHETVRGTWEVYDEEKIIRTIAIDKTRKIRFTVAGAEPPDGDQGAEPDEKTAQESDGNASQEATGAGARTTDQRIPQRTNESAPNRTIRPVPARPGQTRP